MEAWRGPEYGVSRADVSVPIGRRVEHRIVLERLDNLPARGWWSGDVHVHMNYGGAYRNTPRHLALQAHAEDLGLVREVRRRPLRDPAREDVVAQAAAGEADAVRSEVLANSPEGKTMEGFRI